ncbi:MAG: c-type cytochrome [Vicinamibacterales bacterium]
MRAICAVLCGAVFLTSGMFAQAPQTQEPPKTTGGRTVWDGVYTDAQAARGQARYQASCSACHDDGPRRGEAFMRDWGGTAVDGLFGRIKSSMPPGAPSSLSDAEYLDIVAYMLRVNAFPAGRDELTAGAIAGIRIEGPNGPEPVPNFALARVVGCLREGPDAAWVLVEAGEPVRTRDPAASRDDELKGSAEAALGTQTFRLLNVYPRPDPYKGHKVEAKGFLIRDPGGDRINVTSVQTLAPGCETNRAR